MFGHISGKVMLHMKCSQLPCGGQRFLTLFAAQEAEAQTAPTIVQKAHS